MSIRIAAIGAGQNSQRNHFAVLQRLQREGLCSLEMVCDVNRETAKSASARFGFANYTHDVEDVFSSPDIDAVYVLGTVQMHHEYMIRALEAGKHVFVEKPPTPDVASAIAVRNLAQKKQKIAVAGFNRRFYRSINHARSLTDGRSTIYSLEGVYHKQFLDESYMHGSSSWIQYSCIHGIDAACHLLGFYGLPKTLYSAWNIASGDTPQNLSALMVWENGTHAVVSSNQSAGSRMEQYTLHAEGVSYTCSESEFTVQSKDGRKEVIQYKDQFESRGFYDEHKEFFEAIEGKVEARHSIEHSIPTMHLVALMEQGHNGPINWEVLGPSTSVPDQERESARSVRSVAGGMPTEGSILVLNPTALKHLIPDLSKSYTIVYLEDLPSTTPEERMQIVGIVTGPGGSAVTDEILELCQHVRIVGIVGASVKKYNPEAILKRNIPIANASDIYAEAVAEFTLMQALIGIKNASRSHDVMKKGGWGISIQKNSVRFLQYARKTVLQQSLAFFQPILRPLWKSLKRTLPTSITTSATEGVAGGRNLKGLRVGIVGYGAIARAFIQLLKPFGCEIRIFSEYISEEEVREFGLQKGTLAQVLNADIVSLHRGLSPRTLHSFGKAEIALLKKGTVLINTSRGAIIDEEALIERLKNNDMFACLDVFEEEPLPSNSPLRKMPNVFLSSHISGVTTETFKNSPEAVVQKVTQYLKGESVDFLITSQDMLGNMT